MGKQTKDNINTLNSLRIMALIGVVGYHILPQSIIGGYLGVILFFQLSGFLVVYSNRGINNKKDMLHFYIHKIKRIYPALCIMIFSSITIFYVLKIQGLPVSLTELLSIFGGYNNEWQISQDISYFARALNLSPFTHLWFLAIELQFYLIWPIFIYCYKKLENKGYKVLPVIILLTILSVTPMILLTINTGDISNIYYSTFTRIGSIFFGVCVGLIYEKVKEKEYKKWKLIVSKILILLYMLLLSISYFGLDSTWLETYTIGMPLCNFLTAIVLFLLIKYNDHFLISGETFIGRTINKLFMGISKISYEIYLWMFPVIYVFNKLLFENSIQVVLLQVIIILLLGKICNDFKNSLFKIYRFIKKKKSIKQMWASQKNKFQKLVQLLFILIRNTIIATIMIIGLVWASELPLETDNTELNQLLADLVDIENEHAIEKMNLAEEKILLKIEDRIILFETFEQVQEEVLNNQKLKEDYFVKKAEEEARKKAEEEARKKAEEEARKKAEEEARKKAEEEARKKAEEEARKAAATANSSNTSSTNTSSTNTSSTDTSSSSSSTVGIGVSSGKSILFYGDSVMLGAATALKKTFSNAKVDAVTSRQVNTVANSASSIFGSNSGYTTIVLGLGTNGTFKEEKAQTIINAIPSSTQIYWVTARGVSWASSVNSVISKVASQYSNVSVIDWNSYSSGKSSWFYNDGIHLKIDGQNAYAQLMYNKIG